jgi:hypothetical protein
MNVSTLSNTTTREERTLRLLAHAQACARASGSVSALSAATGTGDAYSMLVDQLRSQAGDMAAMCSGGMEVRAHVTAGSRSVVLMRTDSPSAAAGEAARQRMRSATSPGVSDP